MTTDAPDIAFLRRLLVATVGVLTVVSALNLTTSSIALHVAGDQPNSADVLFGELRPIRSDEWNRATPVLLGSFLDEWTPDALTPFEERDVRFGWLGEVALPGIVYPERALVGMLPSRIGFFMFLWIPPIVGVAAVAALLRLAGVGRTSSVAGGVATSLGAASAWWSYHGSQLVWPVALATSLLLLSWALVADRSRLPMIGSVTLRVDLLLAVLAGILLARYPLMYAPWAIPTALLFGALILDFWRSSPARRSTLGLLGVSVLTSVIVSGLSLLSQSPRLSALAGTSYPAARRYSGGSEGMPLFTGAQSYYAQTHRGAVVNGSNLSESAVGPVVLVVVALVLVWFGRTTLLAGQPRTKLGTTAAVTVLLLLWSITEWPAPLLSLNPLTLIPGYRITQIIGVIALPFVWIVIARNGSDMPLTRRGSLAAGVGLVVLTVSAADGVRYRQLFPLVTANETWLMAAVMAGTTAYFVWRSDRPKAAVPLAVFIFVSAAWVNPVVRGVGDLYDSSSAITLREAVSENPGRVASDHVALDALLISNAIPTLGGQLNWGPDEEAWSRLDPDGVSREVWNRGASSLQFHWNEASLSTTISLPFPDVVLVETHPCNPLLTHWGVTWVVSSEPLEAACLVESAQFLWNGLPRWLYNVRR